jgi:hypothetical protein
MPKLTSSRRRRSSHALAAVLASALLFLGGCNAPETIVSGPDDPQGDALKNSAPVAPPPMIRSSRTYRCKDNSLAYVDFYTDRSVRVTLNKGAAATVLRGIADDGRFSADGWRLSGGGDKIELASPGRRAQACKA